MKIVLAPDSFKECLTADAVCTAVATGLLRVCPDAEIVAVPMADGGEGTLEVMLGALAGERRRTTVAGPLGDAVDATWGWLPDSHTAVIEAAAANGLSLVPPERRDPLNASTYGVGQLMLAALAAGATRILLTVGGSATVDGGCGLARALGYHLINTANLDLPDGGGHLEFLRRIDMPARRPWERCRIDVACDVTNPLVGPHGAARVFAPQKGATPEQVEMLEVGLVRLAHVLQAHHGVDLAMLPGGGAAGGLAAGLVAFSGARLSPGVDLVMDVVRLRERLAGADLVITGEGRTDRQSLDGKVVSGVARLAREAGVPCVVLSGAVSLSAKEIEKLGIAAAFSASLGPQSLNAALRDAAPHLAAVAANLLAMYLAGHAAGRAAGSRVEKTIR